MQNATENVRSGVVEFLGSIPVEELSNLATLVTGGLSKTTDRDEIVRVILLHSSSVRGVLLRRVITRNRLYEYLTSKSVSLNAQTTKESLIDAALKYWESSARAGAGTVAQADGVDAPRPERIDEMAVTFVEWFFAMFNAGPEVPETHFWRDASMRLDLVAADGEIATEQVDDDSAGVVRLLSDVRTRHRIHLSPNVCRDGVAGRVDRYGLVVIRVCGTIHSDSRCVGVFEQTFALGTDPAVENNWKIKRVHLRLLNATVTERPTLGSVRIDAGASQRSIQD